MYFSEIAARGVLRKIFKKKKKIKNSQQHICARVFFLIKFQTLFKETLKLVLSFEFYEIFKSIYFEKHLRVVASEVSVSFIFNSLNAKV